MLNRKILSFMLTSFVSIIFVTLVILKVELNDFSLFLMLIVSLLVVTGTLLYGLPLSMLSSVIAERFKGIKYMIISFSLHLFFGMIFIFVLGLLFETKDMLNNFQPFWKNSEMFFISSTTTSIIFWIIDEILRLKLNRNENNYSISNKVIFLNSQQKY